ncbi:MAG TPA: T9SS type A sorting domain-containing protein [Ignavibacteriaceae bacterium]
MLKTITSFTFYFFLFSSLVLAQWKPAKIITNGGEGDNVTVTQQVNPENIGTPVELPNQTVEGAQFTWEMHQITNYMTGYDLQSNGSTQQLWYDPVGGSLNAVFTTSQQPNFGSGGAWTDRTCTYFYSMDGGVNWTNVGNVPPPAPTGARSGFPAINGLSFPSVVIANHNNLGGGNTRTQIMINSAPGVDDFIAFDPGNAPDGDAIWPRLTVTNDDNVVFVASVNGALFQYTNVLNTSTGLFSGYQFYDGNQAETYALAVASNGTVGHAYLGNLGEAFFRESADGGLTWGTPTEIFSPHLVPGDTNYYGTIRGIDLVYHNNIPAVVFEVFVQTPGFASFFPGLPSQILFWSPEITGDTTWVIADSNNVPYYPYNGTNDVMCPLARPVIGKSADGRAIFVAFESATENRATTLDSTTFQAGWFMASFDSGVTWTDPERFTPVTTPHMDWDWVSLAESNPVTGDICTVHMVMQADPIAGSQVNGAFGGVTAGFYHFSTEVDLPPIVSVGDDDNLVNSFQLEQNYPNPFNPSTSIKYTLAEKSNVILKIYDVLGNEIATLVNSEKEVGPHEVNFEASNLSSGLYIYTIQAGNFTASKKMMLLK